MSTVVAHTLNELRGPANAGPFFFVLNVRLVDIVHR